MLIELLRSWQLSRKKREKKLNGGGGGALLAWPTTAASLQITMENHISNWIHKFQNRTGLDAKANSELFKSNWVCSVSGEVRQVALLSSMRGIFSSPRYEYTTCLHTCW